MKRLKEFRVGDEIPDGAIHIRSEVRKIPGTRYEKVVAPRTILSWLGITETVAVMVKTERVEIYEVSE